MAQQYTEEYRAEAVRLALTSGLSRKKVSEDLGIGFSTLSRWIWLHRQSDAAEAPDPDLHQEVIRLRKENRILKEEREILKKATVCPSSYNLSQISAWTKRDFAHRVG